MSEWDKRELCPDGGCVGLLSSDGTCNVCGKRGRAAGVAATTAADSGGAKRGDEATDFDEDDEYYYEDDDSDGDSDEDDDDDDDDEGDADVDEDGVASVSAGAGGGAWTERKLCTDGGCIGVIGDNGVCKVCGKPAS